MKNKLKNKEIFVYCLLSIAFFSLFVFIFLCIPEKPVDVKTLDVKFEVGDRLGLILNDSELDFGTVLPGVSSVKKVDVSNNYGFPVYVRIYVSNNLEDFLFSKSKIFIGEGEMAVVDFHLVVPADAAKKQFSGEVKFKIYKAP